MGWKTIRIGRAETAENVVLLNALRYVEAEFTRVDSESLIHRSEEYLLWSSLVLPLFVALRAFATNVDRLVKPSGSCHDTQGGQISAVIRYSAFS
jgi:hypothetical protein